MRPEANELLMGGFGTLLMEVAPNLNATYATGSATLVGLLMYCASIEYERGAQVRKSENDRFRTVLAEALPHLPAELAGRAQPLIAEEDADLTISALNAANDALRRVLIDVHAHVEDVDAPWARALEHKILKALAASARMRAIELPQL